MSVDVASISLSDKIRALSQSLAYPDPCASVEVVQTHFACVFLAGELAYKLKKPVQVERMDFRDAAARERTCRDELRLNRRLARDVYLDVVPLTLESGGALRVSGVGVAVDWLVKMRRLPSDRMLDRAIAMGTATVAGVDPAAQLLAEFYRDRPAVIRSGAEYLARMHERVQDARTQLSASDLCLDAASIESACARQCNFLRECAPLIEARATEERVVEGHGDLRPEHVFLGSDGMPAAVIDCLEFDLDLRIFDALEELAFLALECDRLGAASLGAEFVRVYRSVMRDDFPPPLFAFYRRQRALTRAKIAAWHLRDAEVRNLADWRALAHKYVWESLQPAQFGG
jgi:aminoglycoside phosphotransferase family enzyme